MKRDLQPNQIARLRAVLASSPQIELAALIGSRSTGTASEESDWDIAIRFLPGAALLHSLAMHEEVRHQCAKALNTTADRIDLIDLRTARLAMRAVVAEEGVPLTGDDTLAWTHFLSRTWRELEEYYWEKDHAA